MNENYSKDLDNLEEAFPEGYKMATRLYFNIYKAVLYVHQEFSYMFQSCYNKAGVGKHLRDRIEEQLMRRWGISKYKDIYLQDELATHKESGAQISIGPDPKSCDFIRTIDSTGKVDEEARYLFMLKYSTIYQEEHDERKRAEEETSSG